MVDQDAIVAKIKEEFPDFDESRFSGFKVEGEDRKIVFLDGSGVWCALQKDNPLFNAPYRAMVLTMDGWKQVAFCK